MPMLLSMLDALAALPPLGMIALFAATGALLGSLGVYLSRRLHPRKLLEGVDVRAAGAIFSVTGALVSLLLAFIVVTVWQNREEYRKRIVAEACELGNLYRAADHLEPRLGDELRSSVTRYLQAIIEGWEIGTTEGMEARPATEAFDSLHSLLVRHSPSTPKEEAHYQNLLTKLDALATFRRLRITAGRSSIPAPFWLTVTFSSFVSVAFALVFRIESALLQAIITAAYGAVLSSIIGLVVLLDHPFKSSIGLTPAPFVRLVAIAANQ